jgi:hypothetical protein
MVLTTDTTRGEVFILRTASGIGRWGWEGRQARPTKHVGRLNSLEREGPG